MAERSATGQGSAAVKAEGPWTVRRLLAWMQSFLGEKGVDSPRHIAEILLSHVLKVERLKLYLEPDRELDPIELAELRALVMRAARHEPVQFLVGRWTFLGRDFDVAPCTLIPRPCTEKLVERALEWYRVRGGSAVRALDLCTGTGCIAISLYLGMRAIARPSGAGCRPILGAPPEAAAGADSSMVVVATDVVPAAVELARGNAARLGAPIECRQGDLWSAVDPAERFDLIVSNPPYVTDDEFAQLDRNVREYEPATALRGGRDGLDFVRKIVAGARERLSPTGLLLLEIGWKQAEEVRRMLAADGWHSITTTRDDEGHERIIGASIAQH
ncbi:MAG: Release factor glutamine methyltransferase [Planctomycetota bacterium]